MSVQGALLAVNNVACPAGAPSSPVELAPHKPTAVAIVVTASDTKSTSTYTVMVSMPSAPEVKPQLKALTISKGTLVVSVGKLERKFEGNRRVGFWLWRGLVFRFGLPGAVFVVPVADCGCFGPF